MRLLAEERALTQTAAFNAEVKTDVLQLVSAAGPTVALGETAATAFAVKLVRVDGVTPVGGVAVVFSGSGIEFGCGASGCTVVTDASGLAGTSVKGLVAGATVLRAAAEGVAVSSALEVRTNVFAVTVQPAALWVAAAATLRTELTGSALKNGLAAVGQGLTWQGAGGVQVVAGTGVAGADGTGLMPVVLGPLAAGASGTTTLCAWNTVCATFRATGVAEEEMQVQLTAGAAQSVNAGDAFRAVTVKIIDGAGHAVGGAGVSVYQAVVPATLVCPGTGRCAAAETLRAQTTVLTSAEDGTVTVLPLTVADGATRTEMVFTCGTQSTISTVLNRLQ